MRIRSLPAFSQGQKLSTSDEPSHEGTGRPAGARCKNNGAVRMKLWVRVFRGVCVAAGMCGAGVLSQGVGALVVTVAAFAQSASSIVVQGNRRVDAATIRSYFRTGPGEEQTRDMLSCK